MREESGVKSFLGASKVVRILSTWESANGKLHRSSWLIPKQGGTESKGSHIRKKKKKM